MDVVEAANTLLPPDHRIHIYFLILGHTTDSARVTGLFQMNEDLEPGLFWSQFHSLLLGHNIGRTVLCHGNPPHMCCLNRPDHPVHPDKHFCSKLCE